MQVILNKLIKKNDLTMEESYSLAVAMMQGQLSSSLMAAMLIALRMKEESESELLGFIKAMRAQMQTINAKGQVVDTCGTGGDGKKTFNISTASALVVAGAGIKVAKHGNRSASSLCGSADVLEALGVNIGMSFKQAEKLLEAAGFTFLFAPIYHSSMKNVAGVRKELKTRTIFNFLGPFTNPAQVKRQIIGISDIAYAKKLVNVAKQLDYQHLLIVHSRDGLDEISLSSSTQIFELKNNQVKQYVIEPKNFGIKKAPLIRITGGSIAQNVEIIKNVLSGITGPQRDVVVLNSAAALYVSGKANNMAEGVEMAKQSLNSGMAKQVLEQVILKSQNI